MKNKIDQVSTGSDALIRQLSAQAGVRRRFSMSFDGALCLSLVVSLAAALILVLAVPGFRAGLPQVMLMRLFQFKVAAMGLLVLGGGILMRSAGIPGAPLRPWASLAPAVLLMLIGIVVDDSGFSVWGVRALSVPACVGSIVLASMPGIAVFALGLRRGIPTRLRSAGAAVGFLAGAVGALAYTLACVNDGALFVVIWYLVAISITTGIGAMAGRRALSW